ncbi:hypothetical protein [Rhodospirillum sp. A1_3_36]|uniref:hypothetical protein n=1 Tax=Rhodospirillum sp. A1_3_36 TaxID=3391666 RepID=UPI0039A758FD
MKQRGRIVAVAAWMLVAPFGVAGLARADTLIDQSVLDGIRGWLDSPVVQTTLLARQKEVSAYTQKEIDAWDKRWRAERDQQDQPLVASVMASPLSTYLLRIQAMSTGLYTEIILMDAKGLNAGLSSISSDYWQGDEAKFQKTFDVGADAVFVDEPEHNDKTGTDRVQVNLTIPDSAGAPLGAVAVEVNLTELARRRALGL